MRKVVTGEQVAQLVNPDPFALPVWRAPVYRTPAIFTLAVQLYRLVSWLVRIIVRHPAAVSILALAALTWLNLGWVALVALAGAAVMVLAYVAVVLAGLVRPVGPVPCPERVAVLAVPAPLGRGDDDRRGRSVVPGPGPAAGAGQGHLDPVCRPGTGPAGLGPVCG